MIVVRVELHSAITGRVTELARMAIDNRGGTVERGDYGVRTFRGRSSNELDRSQARNGITREGKVTGHARLKLHVWHLVAKALLSIGYGSDRG